MNGLERVCRPIRAGLDEVDRLIGERVHPRFRALAGGKRLRPALVLFAAGGTRPDVSRQAVRVAAALELVHVASLVHDDVLDSSPRRHSAPALHRLIGIRPAVLLADLLFVEGLALIDGAGSALVHEVIAGVREMCEGQWLEVRLARKRRPTWSEYSEVIDKKTASLFACCCRAGGLVRHAPKMELSALERFGRAFGRAFQLMDDAADAGSDRVRLPVGPRVLRRRASAQAASARAALAPLASRQERAGLAGLTTAVYEG